MWPRVRLRRVSSVLENARDTVGALVVPLHVRRVLSVLLDGLDEAYEDVIALEDDDVGQRAPRPAARATQESPWTNP